MLFTAFLRQLKPVHRLVKYKQLRIFYECPGEQCQSLFTSGECVEPSWRYILHVQKSQPFVSLAELCGCQSGEAAYSVVQSPRYNLAHSIRPSAEVKVHFRRYIAYALFNVPDAFAGASSHSENLYIV